MDCKSCFSQYWQLSGDNTSCWLCSKSFKGCVHWINRVMHIKWIYQFVFFQVGHTESEHQTNQLIKLSIYIEWICQFVFFWFVTQHQNIKLINSLSFTSSQLLFLEIKWSYISMLLWKYKNKSYDEKRPDINFILISSKSCEIPLWWFFL